MPESKPTPRRPAASPPGTGGTAVWVVRLLIVAMAAAITWLLLHLL